MDRLALDTLQAAPEREVLVAQLGALLLELLGKHQLEVLGGPSLGPAEAKVFVRLCRGVEVTHFFVSGCGSLLSLLLVLEDASFDLVRQLGVLQFKVTELVAILGLFAL